MAEIKLPLQGIEIRMDWNSKLVLPPDEMECLVALLNKGELITTSYNSDPKLDKWGEGSNTVTFSPISDETLAEAKMHSVLYT